MNFHWKKVAFLINRRRLSSWAGILALLFLISGCAGRPYLTQDNSYSIIKVSPEGETQKTPIQLTWNSNAAVMQKLLLEASFVLSDLHTQLGPEKESTDNENPNTESSESEFSKATQLISGTLNLENPKVITEPISDIVLLEANFPQAKQFNLIIDDEEYTLDISSIQIEVEGNNPGRVILNQVLTLQGIPNPNLIRSFDEFTQMLKKIKREAR